MSQTIYASFADAALCEKAAGALLDYGVRKEDISLVANNAILNRTADGEYGVKGGALRGSTVDADEIRDDHGSHIEGAAKHGISTTTPGDAAAGAAKGAGIGLGVGIAAGVLAFATAGVAPIAIAGAGALATAIAGAVGTTAAGAVAGGVTGYFKDQGIDAAATTYDDAIKHGGAVLAVTVPSSNVDVATATSVLQKYGAANMSAF